MIPSQLTTAMILADCRRRDTKWPWPVKDFAAKLKVELLDDGAARF